MSSIRNQILEYVKDLIADGEDRPEQLVTVVRGRRLPLRQDQLIAASVYPLEDPVDRDTNAPTALHRLRFGVELGAAGRDDDIPDEILDPAYVYIVKSIMADRTLGGLVLDVMEINTQWATAKPKEVTYGGSRTDFEVEYVTDERDPEVPG